MRKAMYSLSALVVSEIKLKPDDGSLYIFYNKALNKIKILFHDRNGFVLYYKALSRKKFGIIKSQGMQCSELTPKQLDWLLAGLDIEVAQEFPEINYSYFF